jgi:PKD repeat protein
MYRLALLFLMGAAAGCEKLPAAPELPNDTPTAAFFLTPVAPIYAGQSPVAFNAMGSHDRDGQIVSYIWNFGDGTREETTTGPSILHTFRDTGGRCLNITYGVSLVVIDDRGGRGVAAQGVTVTQLPSPNSSECLGSR